jgi:hypothetical protein
MKSIYFSKRGNSNSLAGTGYDLRLLNSAFHSIGEAQEIHSPLFL